MRASILVKHLPSWDHIGFNAQLVSCMSIIAYFYHVEYILVLEKYYELLVVEWDAIQRLHDNAWRILVYESIGLLLDHYVDIVHKIVKFKGIYQGQL